jgi:hypothetical protein
MGSSIDVQKLVSSMTLFRAVAPRVDDPAAARDCRQIAEAAAEILRAAAAEGYPPCAFTDSALSSSR